MALVRESKNNKEVNIEYLLSLTINGPDSVKLFDLIVGKDSLGIVSL